MDIKITPASVKSNRPAFTAQLKGSAVRIAVKDAIDAFQVAEVKEIVDNVKLFGDSTTKIDCRADGLISVSNQKFGNHIHKFKLRKNNSSENPCLELLRAFNSQNGLLKVEHGFLGFVFEHIKSPAMKEAKYKLYSSLPISTGTRCVLDNVAKQHGVLPSTAGNEDPKAALEKVKTVFLKMLEIK